MTAATTPRVVVRFEPTRFCESCGSCRLALFDYGSGIWRKECEDCHSTGPFIDADARVAS